jgi:hypothetical protein
MKSEKGTISSPTLAHQSKKIASSYRVFQLRNPWLTAHGESPPYKIHRQVQGSWTVNALRAGEAI